MPLSPLFLDPANEQEKMQMQKVEQLVRFHFHDLMSHTSASMGKILRKIIVRVMWDSSTKNKYGEYYGVPAPKQGVYDTGMLPPEIVIFSSPLVRDFPHHTALDEKVRKVVVHEIGHHLGLSEEELRRRKIY